MRRAAIPAVRQLAGSAVNDASELIEADRKLFVRNGDALSIEPLTLP